jgi:hypothetical protein
MKCEPPAAAFFPRKCCAESQRSLERSGRHQTIRKYFENGIFLKNLFSKVFQLFSTENRFSKNQSCNSMAFFEMGFEVP